MRKIYTKACFFVYPVFIIAILSLISACNSSGSLGNQPLSFDVFSGQFPQLTLPYSYTDDSLLSAMPDSLRIKDPDHIRFVPDSVFFPDGDTTAKVYVIGRGKSDEKHKQWLFLKTVTENAKRVYALIYDNQDSLIVAKKVAAKEEDAKNKTLTFKWTGNHLLNLYEKTALGDGFVSYKREVYSLLGGDNLQLILTNNKGPESNK